MVFLSGVPSFAFAQGFELNDIESENRAGDEFPNESSSVA